MSAEAGLARAPVSASPASSTGGGVFLAVIDVLAVAFLVLVGGSLAGFLGSFGLVSAAGRSALVSACALLGPTGVGIERGRSERPALALALAVALVASAAGLAVELGVLLPVLSHLGLPFAVSASPLAWPLAGLDFVLGVPLVFLGTRLSRRDDAWRAIAREGPPDATPELARRIAALRLPLVLRVILFPVGLAALPLGLVGLVLVRSYQITASRLMPNQCRFEPHCSKYGFEAIRAHGAFRGVFLTVFRVLRCQPFGTAGHDPVPLRESRE